MKGNFLLLGLLLLSAGCKNTGPLQPEQGFLTGQVAGTSGASLPGAKVVASNTMIYHSSATGTSDQNGNFKIQLPKVGTFVASASLLRSYNGKQYELDLHPDQTDPFSIDGATINFEWKLTGKKPFDNEGYYGATIVVNKSPLSQIYDSENIEFTLIPDGPLIDGSSGATLQRRPGQPFTATYDQLVDIPLGRYIVTAVYKGSIPLKLKRHFSDDTYTPDLVVDFEPDNIWGKNSAFITYQEHR